MLSAVSRETAGDIRQRPTAKPPWNETKPWGHPADASCAHETSAVTDVPEPCDDWTPLLIAVRPDFGGTHDTETIRLWWDAAPADERDKIGCIESVRRVLAARGLDESALVRPFDDTVRDVLLEVLYASGSDYLILPLQDVFGWPDRVNVPATVDDTNWTWRVPAAVDRVDDLPEWQDRAAALKTWSAAYNR